MSTQSSILVKAEDAIVGYYEVLEVVVSTNDTFKPKGISQIQGVVALRMSDWSSVSCTYAGNVVTVTQSGLSRVRIVALIGGLK